MRFKKITLLFILLISLITNGLSQNNVFVYEVKTTLKKEEQKVFSLKNLDAILVKNKTNEPLDVKFTLLWHMYPVTTNGQQAYRRVECRSVHNAGDAAGKQGHITAFVGGGWVIFLKSTHSRQGW